MGLDFGSKETDEMAVCGIQAFKGTGVGLHVSSVYGIPLIPTKQDEQKPKIILCSTPSKKDNFYSRMANESASLTLSPKAWGALNLEANVFAQLPKISWKNDGWTETPNLTFNYLDDAMKKMRNSFEREYECLFFKENRPTIRITAK